MQPLDRLYAAARAARRRIVLAEGEDPRILAAAVRAEAEGLAELTLLGRTDTVAAGLTAAGGDPARFEIIDPATAPSRFAFVETYRTLRAGRADAADAEAILLDPLAFAAMLVRSGGAHGMIGGAVATTAHTVRTALRIIGPAPGTRLVSSFFLMLLCSPDQVRKGGFVFSDCGLVVDPNAEELAEIALAASDSCAALLGTEPRVAMLSFSTMGSATHARVDTVRAATEIVRNRRPDLAIDGELQFDAAFVPLVNASKAPGSATRGEANVLIFPNLEAGNIGYKIAQRIGGALAIGPVLQGLAHPANDLSRGCTADDVRALIAVTAVQQAAPAA